MERNTLQQGNGPSLEYLDLPVAANAKVEAGNLGVINAAGYLEHGSAALNLKAVGRIDQSADNTGGAAGAKRVRVRRGVFKWNNSGAADQITQADLYNDCYVVNSTTVAKTNGGGTRSKAGRVVGVEADGVWVETF